MIIIIFIKIKNHFLLLAIFFPLYVQDLIYLQCEIEELRRSKKLDI